MANLTEQIVLQLKVEGNERLISALKKISKEIEEVAQKNHEADEVSKSHVKTLDKLRAKIEAQGLSLKKTRGSATQWRQALQGNDIMLTKVINRVNKRIAVDKAHARALNDDVVMAEKKATTVLKAHIAATEEYRQREKQANAVREKGKTTLTILSMKLKENGLALKNLAGVQGHLAKARAGNTNSIRMMTAATNAAIRASKKATADAQKKATLAKKEKANIQAVRFELRLLERQYKQAHGINIQEVADKNLLTKAYRGNRFALRELRLELKLYERGQIKSTKTGQFHVRNQRLLNSSFAVYRSKLLLASFALGLYTRTIGKLIGLASDLEQQISKFNIVFGESAEGALEFAHILADNVGRSISSVVPLMAQLQDTFVPLGFARDKAAELSEAMAQLAMDVESLSNIPMEDVARGFTSAIVGNHEAVRAFGIVLTEASVKEKAYAMGIAEANSELDNQQKVVARTAIILESTRDAWGNAAATSREFANVLRSFNDQWKDVAISIGDTAKPMASFVLQSLKPGSAALYVFAAALAAVAIKLAIVNKKLLFSKTAMMKSGWLIFVVVLAEAAFWLQKNLKLQMRHRNAVEDGAEKVKDYNEVLEGLGNLLDVEARTREEAIAKLNAYNESVVEHTLSLKKELALLLAKTDLQKREIELGRELTDVEILLVNRINEIVEAKKAEKQAMKDAKAEAKAEAKAQEEALKIRKEIQDSIMSAQMKLYAEQIDLALKEKTVSKAKADDLKEFLELQKSLTRAFGDRVIIEGKLAELNDPKTLENLSISIEGAMEGEKALLQILMDTYDIRVKNNDEIKEEHELLATKTDLQQEVYGALASMVTSHQASIIQANQQTAAAEIRALEKTRKYKRADAAGQKKMRDELTKDNQDAIKDAFRLQQLAQVGQVWMNIALAVTKEYGKGGLWTGLLAQPFLMGVGAVQSAAIMAQQVPTAYAKGGEFITDRPELIQVGEAGREHVKITPIDRPPERALGSSPITINFSGNVMSQDFIENEAIPQIKEAVRRGADLGIS